MTVTECVNHIRHLDNEISFKQRQRAELFEMLTSITAPLSEAVQSTSEDKVSSLVAQYVDLSSEIIDTYRRKFNAENEFHALAAQLPPQWEELLLLRYLSGMTFENISAEMGYSREWCWKTNNKARTALQDLIDQKERQKS